MNLLIELSCVLFVLVAYMGLGQLLLKILKLERIDGALKFLIGGGLYALIVFLLGRISMTTYVSLLVGFCSFGISLVKERPDLSKIRHLPVPVLAYLIFSFFIALYPSTYFDPLNYHLYGIIEWAKLDQIIHLKSAIQVMHNSYGDYLYFPFAVFFDLSNVQSLVSVQICSQLLTVFLGITLFCYLLIKLLEKKINPIWLPLIVLAVITRASLQHKGLIAKNDWIALSWFLGAAYLYFNSQEMRFKKLMLAAALLGLSIGAKFTYIIPAVLFLIWILVTEKNKNIPTLFWCGCIVFITVFPYFYRNYVWTGNPIFPLGNKFFSSPFLGPSWSDGFQYFDAHLNEFSWELITNKLFRVFTYEPVVYFWLLIPLVFRGIFNPMTFAWVIVFCFSIVFIFLFGPKSELRHFGPIALLVNFFGTHALVTLTEKWVPNENYKKFISGFFILAIVINLLKLENQLNPIPSALREGQFYPRTLSLIKERRGLVLTQKLPHFLSKNTKAALLDDTPPYYFSPHQIIRLWDDPDLDRSLQHCQDLICVVSILDRWQIGYLIETGFYFDPYYNPLITAAILSIKNRHPQIVVVNSNGENLISVNELKKVIEVK